MKSSKIVMAAAMAAALASMGCKQALTKDEFIAASKDLQDSNSNVYTANQLKRTAWQDFSHELQSLFASTSEATVKKTAIEAKVTAFNAQQKKIPHKFYGNRPYVTLAYTGGDLKKADYYTLPSFTEEQDAKLAKLFEYKIEGDLSAN